MKASIIIVGAYAYAVIRRENGALTDIRLSPGKSAHASLREYAEEMRAKANHCMKMAEIAECAAEELLNDGRDLIPNVPVARRD
jgi:protein subunit release factor B